jgi:hypothetical protein
VSAIFKGAWALRGTEKRGEREKKREKRGREEEGIPVLAPLFHNFPMTLPLSIFHALNQRYQKYPGPQRSLGSGKFPKIPGALEISGPPEITGPPEFCGPSEIPGTLGIPRPWRSLNTPRFLAPRNFKNT